MIIRKVIGALLLSLLLNACANEKQRQLQQMVDESNATCPVAVNDNVKIDNIDYSDNIITYTVDVDGVIPVRQLQGESELIDRLVRKAVLENPSPEVRLQLQTCKEAGAKLKFVIKGSDGTSLDIMVDPAEFD